MKLVIQRVARAAVSVDGQEVGAISRGLVVLIGVAVDDTPAMALKLAAKTAALRIFPDDRGVMNRSALDTGAEVLVVSQFTLLADAAKGNRPSYVHAAGHELATQLYELYVSELERILGRPVPTGRFGADMQISLLADGPVTILLDL